MISYERLTEVCKAVSVPVVAIGGITKDNMDSLFGSGISGIAVVSAIFAQPDIRGAANLLKQKLLHMEQRKGR
ncbi:Thiamine-phosphate synthase [Eubacterium plexicaudatum ASF492]|nr:Thiamine-phosphate synthase [Eubacterium plexicaudatum ASF492]